MVPGGARFSADGIIIIFGGGCVKVVYNSKFKKNANLTGIETTGGIWDTDCNPTLGALVAIGTL